MTPAQARSLKRGVLVGRRVVCLLTLMLGYWFGPSLLAEGPERAVPLGEGRVAGVALSPEGSVLAVATSAGLEVHVLEDKGEPAFYPAATGPVNAVAFSPDGMLLAWSAGRQVVVWHRMIHETVVVLEGHAGVVTSVDFSEDGTMMVTGSVDGIVTLWDVWSGKLLNTLEAHKEAVLGVAVSPDGTHIVSGSLEETVLWDAETGKAVRALACDGWVEGVSFCPKGTLVAACQLDGTLRLWDVDTGREVSKGRVPGGVGTSVAFSPNGDFVACGGHEVTAVWQVGSPDPVIVLRGHTGLVAAVVFSSDNRVLVSVSWDGTAGLWNLSQWLQVRVLSGHTRSVDSVAFAPTGMLAASGSADRTIRLWDVTAGEEVRSMEGLRGTVATVAFSPNGRALASGGAGDTSVFIWDIRTGERLHTLAGHTRSVDTVAFSHDGRVLASGAGDATVRLWDPATGRHLRTLSDGLSRTVRTVAFSPDDATIATGCDSTAVRLWSVRTGALLRTLEGHTRSVNAVAFSPDGRTLASASTDTTVRLWDVTTGEELRRIEQHDRSVRTVAFSPDGVLMVTGGLDNSIRIWRTADGQLLHVLDEHASPVHSVAFSPDGRVLISGTGDHTPRLWSLDYVLASSPVSAFSWGAVDDDGNRLPIQPWAGGRVQFDVLFAGEDGHTAALELDWDFAGAPSLNTENGHAVHVFDAAGRYPVTLRVTDDAGTVREMTRSIAVAERVRPTAAFGYVPLVPTILDTIQFEDTSDFAGLGAGSWRWEFGDGTVSSAQHPVHRYAHNGAYTVVLVVEDEQGRTDAVTAELTVANLPPRATFRHVPEVVRANASVTFDASDSADPDGEIVLYRWDLGDGNRAHGEVVQHTYTEPGSYAVELTVTDDEGAVDRSRREIFVVIGGGGGPV